MNRKGFATIPVIILIIALVAIAGYFVVVKTLPSTTKQPELTNNTPPPSVEDKIPKNTPPPIAQKKLTIHCKPAVLPNSQGDVVFLGFELSLVTPCPTDEGVIKARATVSGPLGSDQRTINLSFLQQGNVAQVGEKVYSFEFSNQPVARNVDLQITGHGMVSLDARANVVVDGKDIGGGADSIFFLLASDGEFIVSRSSYFELERTKLANDLQARLIDKTKYDQEMQKMLEGKHTYICSQITCY